MRNFLFIFGCLVLWGCSTPAEHDIPDFAFTKYSIDGKSGSAVSGTTVIPTIRVTFNASLDSISASKAVQLYSSGKLVAVSIHLENKDSVLVFRPVSPLPFLASHDVLIDNQLQSADGRNLLSACQFRFTTAVDPADKFPRVDDETLLTLLQRKTFSYFWEFGHPVSGLARERNSSGDLVTSGGSGFGIMALVVGVERGFITRSEGLGRLKKITDFLLFKADRFHGAFPHWLNGATGKVIPFSPKDDGGDLVETSYLMAGLLCASSYFDQATPEETTLRKNIDMLWHDVEWNWYTQGKDVLYWHWSPNYQWAMNHRIQGWNEALITYILAAASPTYPITKKVYDAGWALNGAIRNGRSFYGISLPLGPDIGGPLFFSHYSFLGIDPRNLKDAYGNYQQQVRAHTLIQTNYCIKNPRNYDGYSADCWGLTASDNPWGYDAHSPTNDKGVISPTAALSSMPFTPEESMRATRYFYYVLGDKIFGQYGFTDAFSLTHSWFANSFLAIDQGPILIMIENHRSGLVWRTTMKHPDIQRGLDNLGFTY